jgi:hypothetical protein
MVAPGGSVMMSTVLLREEPHPWLLAKISAKTAHRSTGRPQRITPA